jgi:hypothetical protein
VGWLARLLWSGLRRPPETLETGSFDLPYLLDDEPPALHVAMQLRLLGTRPVEEIGLMRVIAATTLEVLNMQGQVGVGRAA